MYKPVNKHLDVDRCEKINLEKNVSIFEEITNQVLDLSGSYEEEHLWYRDDLDFTKKIKKNFYFWMKFFLFLFLFNF